MHNRLMEEVLERRSRYDFDAATTEEVLAALAKEAITIDDFGTLLSPAAEHCLERMALRSMEKTVKHFGNGIQLFTPLYLSNYCDNHCVYCGFNCKNDIRRSKLSLGEMEMSMSSIAGTGLREILLLTGESRRMTDVEYIGEAVKMASRYFTTVGLEIYPLEKEEYAFLQACGADFVSVYQETYDLERYRQVHLKGRKRDFAYRFGSQERALEGGMRGVAFGSLLGLDDFRKDAFAAGIHGYLVQKRHPHAEISFSFPRLRPFIHGDGQTAAGVGEKQLLQVMLAYRIFMPFAGMTISTRERQAFRDNAAGLCATKMSAGVKVGVGGHETEQTGDDQFEIADPRSVPQIHDALVRRGLQPVYTDYVRVQQC